ncbi:MAG TPA: hypothetical protein ENI32_02590 [Candidatus Syntrophoarchaeum butanivorans]|uniref:Uncharacterized protein n=1 Tax=Candidatus Syntropharchaeum butanivorans TaxID=1839936 RepID=A0A1F2P4B2_9EURY|nr:MAG: hypothetical protein SBU_001190 [Candidatus Syntrophoarchaeum butanivorans]RJS73565.1 MAG: hypothetical protein CW694_00285 [Candidatus Syntrophoarchaeum sp. WYZ-LMO15]HEC56760.1 hypothetical protein [Candidatus Syntrophoarchaeum butanivorans]
MAVGVTYQLHQYKYSLVPVNAPYFRNDIDVGYRTSPLPIQAFTVEVKRSGKEMLVRIRMREEVVWMKSYA